MNIRLYVLMSALNAQAPLEAAAATRFNEIISNRARSTFQDLNIGSSYTGDIAWLSRF